MFGSWFCNFAIERGGGQARLRVPREAVREGKVNMSTGAETQTHIDASSKMIRALSNKFVRDVRARKQKEGVWKPLSYRLTKKASGAGNCAVPF